MTASIRIKGEAAPLAADDLCLDRIDEAAEPYTWLDRHTDSDSKTAAEDIDSVDLDSDQVPTLYDVYEQTYVFSPDDSHDDDQKGDSVFRQSGDDLPETQARYPAFVIDAEPEIPVRVEESAVAHHADPEAALADHQSDSSQPPMQSMEEVFNQVRRDPVLLQRALLVVACTFQVIAAAALWHAIGNKVVVTELVPPLVYASIGVVAYLLGMRYLRIHFAQARVGDKDWLQCEQVMVGADNGVMLKARFGTAYLIWEQLLGVAQDNDFYYLLIEPSQGFKVPKQGVSDPVLKIKFEDLASLTRAKALQGM